MAAELIDVTSCYAVLSLMGPDARNILQSVTGHDISNEEFPFGTVQELTVAGCTVRALRMTYVGELGWELHIPVESATNVYEHLLRYGEKFGLRNAGYRAIESLRLEKGYCAWASDFSPDTSPLEAGMGWAVKLKSGKDFHGRAALENQKKSGLKKMLATFTVADPAKPLFGRETIYRNGQRAGLLSSGGYGYTIGQNIGYGYVRNDKGVTRQFLESGDYELDIAGQRVSCAIHLSALYDPEMKKIRC